MSRLTLQNTSIGATALLQKKDAQSAISQHYAAAALVFHAGPSHDVRTRHQVGVAPTESKSAIRHTGLPYPLRVYDDRSPSNRIPGSAQDSLFLVGCRVSLGFQVGQPCAHRNEDAQASPARWSRCRLRIFAGVPLGIAISIEEFIAGTHRASRRSSWRFRRRCR